MTESCNGVMFVNIFRFGLPVAFWRYRGLPDPLPPLALGLLGAGLGGGVGHWPVEMGLTCVWPNVYGPLLLVFVSK